MNVNRYKLNLNNFLSSSATTISIPFRMEYQLVDNNEEIKSVFVENEIQKSVNPIIDYEKSRFIPKSNLNSDISSITYAINALSNDVLLPITYYSDLGFTNEDIKYKKNYFKESYLYCQFFDTDTPLNQNLVTSLILYPTITKNDIYPLKSNEGRPGHVKLASQIPVNFTLSNPVINPDGATEGFYIYDYKSNYESGLPKYLYMRASFNNAKTGKSFNLITEGQAFPIDILIKKLYTRYVLYKDNTGFNYKIDTLYSSNINQNSDDNKTNLRIDLYQIQAL